MNKKEEKTYDSNKDNCVNVEVKKYYWSTNNREYGIEIWLYETLNDLRSGYSETSKIKRFESVDIFQEANSNDTFVGVIKISKEYLTTDILIHEAFHAGIELQHHLGRHAFKRYEEDIVIAGSTLASQLLIDYKDLITKE